MQEDRSATPGGPRANDPPSPGGRPAARRWMNSSATSSVRHRRAHRPGGPWPWSSASTCAARGPGQATGLWLPVSRSNLEAHGGPIRVECVTGVGATFIIGLSGPAVALSES